MYTLDFELTNADYGYVDYSAIVAFPNPDLWLHVAATWDILEETGYYFTYVNNQNGTEMGYKSVQEGLSLEDFTKLIGRNPVEDFENA